MLTCVSSLALSLVAKRNTRSRMHDCRLLDNQTVTVQLGNIPAGVGKGNLVDFIGVEPNLALTTLEHRCGQTLLQSE